MNGRNGTIFRGKVAALIAAAWMSFAVEELGAQTAVWDGGGGNNNWTTANNWNPNGTPTSSSNLAVVFAGNTRLNPVANTTSPWEVLSITFSNTAGAFTLSGNPLSIYSGGIVNNDTQNQTINNNINLAADQTWNAAAGALTFGANGGTRETITNNVTLTLGGNNAITVYHQFVGTGNLVKIGTGTATLNYGQVAPYSVYSGSTAVNGGTLALDLGEAESGNGAPLRGAVTIGDGTGTDTLELRWFDQISDTTTVTMASSGVLWLRDFYSGAKNDTVGALTIDGGAQVTIDANFTLGLSNGVTRTAAGTAAASISGAGRVDLLGATVTLAVGDNPSAANDLVIGAVVSNGAVLKTGAGTLVLNGTAANVYAGDTTVQEGTLVLDKTDGVTAVAGNLAISNATLRLSSSNQIADTATLTLDDNARVEMSGQRETVAATTLQGNNVVFDFGTSSTNVFNAGNLSFNGFTFSIHNWSGAPYQTNSLDMFTASTSFGSMTNQVFFYSDNGMTPVGDGRAVSVFVSAGVYQIVPVPEPDARLLALLALPLLAAVLRKKIALHRQAARG